MEGVEFLGWIGLAFGVASRIFVPWLMERRNNPEGADWSWRYLWPQLVGVAIVALLLPLILPSLETIGGMAFAPAYVVGWGSADLGRFTAKSITKS